MSEVLALGVNVVGDVTGRDEKVIDLREYVISSMILRRNRMRLKAGLRGREEEVVEDEGIAGKAVNGSSESY